MPVYDLQNNLSAAWKLDESSGSRAATIGGLTLTDNGSVGNATGLQYALAANFVPASTHYLSSADNALLDLGTGDFAMIFTLYPGSTGVDTRIWSHYADANNYAEFRQFSYDAFGFEVVIGGVQKIFVRTQSSLPLFSGLWGTFMVLVDRDSAANTRLIFNNSDNTSTGTVVVSTDDISIAGSLNIGRSGAANQYWNGRCGPIILSKGYLPSAPEQFWLANNGSGRTLTEVSAGMDQVKALVVCEGDSITWGYGISPGSKYPQQLQTALGTSYLVLNSAANSKHIDSSGTNDAVDEADRIDGCYDAARPANILVVWLGTNDINTGDSGSTAYTQLVSYCQARQAAGWQVVVCTMLPRGAGNETARTTFNTSIRTDWATFADALADIAADTTIGDLGDESNATYYSDSVHLTAAGATIAMGYVETAVRSLWEPSMVAIPGQSIQFPSDDGAFETYGFTSSLVIDAAGEKVAMMGHVWTPDRTAKSITKIHFRFNTVVKSGGSGLRVSLQNVLANTNGPVPDETQDEYADIANGNASFVSNGWMTTGALSANRSVSPGDLLAVVIEFDPTGWITPDSVQIACPTVTGPAARYSLPSTAIKTGGSWGLGSSTRPNVLFEFSDGTFGTFAGADVCSDLNSHAIKQDTAGSDEYAMRFSFPVAVTVDGCFVRVNPSATTADFNIVLYDSVDTELANISVDGAIRNLDYKPMFLQFPSEVNLTANAVYRLSCRPNQTTSTVTVYTKDVNTANHMVVHQGGTSIYSSTRLNLGTWTDTTTRRLHGFGLSISAIDAGSGGSGRPALINNSNLVRGFVF